MGLVHLSRPIFPTESYIGSYETGAWLQISAKIVRTPVQFGWFAIASTPLLY